MTRCLDAYWAKAAPPDQARIVRLLELDDTTLLRCLRDGAELDDKELNALAASLRTNS